MSLEPLHEHIVRLAFDLPAAQQVALAGGGAMLAHDLVIRPTQDVDLFTPDADEAARLVDGLIQVLQDSGAQVETDQRGPGFARLAVTMPDGAVVAVEVAQDARMRPAVQLGFGPVLHPDEVAADKTLALFGRAAARDLVDVHALAERYSLARLCALAAEKDPGFDPTVLADALRVAATRGDTAFTELGLSADSLASLRDWADHARHHLLSNPTGSPGPGHAPSPEHPHVDTPTAPDTTRHPTEPQRRRPHPPPWQPGGPSRSL